MLDDPGETILVVDDNTANVILLTRILTNSGYHVLTADNGLAAISIARETSPNLILMDINMPGMDGLEACERLKQDPQTEAIPVMFISAADDLNHKVKAFRVGAVDFVLKPFEYAEIRVRVEAHLSIQRLRNQLQAANRELAARVEELTRYQEQLSERERRLDAFIRALPHLSFVFDQDGRYLEVMGTETNLLRAQVDVLKSSSIRDVMPEQVADLLMTTIQSTIQTGKPQIVEYKIAVLAGDERWFEGRTALMERNANGSKVVFIASEITERIQLYQQVQRLANQDPLTNCYNRRHFMTLAETELQRVLRYKRPLALIMFDIDHFKDFNDRYGHQTGDQLLCSLVGQCQKLLRTVDILGRYGGEEFVILMSETDESGALQAAERLRERIENLTIATSAGNLSVTISLGVAGIEKGGTSVQTVDMLVKYADQALYAAKNAGRNCVKAHSSLSK